MKILTQSLALTGLLLLPCPAPAADTSDFDLLKTMSVSDFRASGLDKLSDSQLKSLNAWFAEYQRQHMACAAASQTGMPAASPTAQTTDSFPLVAHLMGKFTGWSGATDFTLDNGEVWEQVDDSSFSSAAIMNPAVSITRSSLGGYYLSIEGVRETVLVKRIKH